VNGLPSESGRPPTDRRALTDTSIRDRDLRHTFVSLLIHEGKSIAYVAEQAGHTVEECARTYTHLFDEYRDAKPVPAEDLIRSARNRVQHGRAAF
jgi:integrase